MEIDFVKMHGLGNDFIFIDDFSTEVELSTDQVKFLCDRHFGIGADGVILVRPSENPECAAYMHYINSDGTLAQMCGNGVRCFAKYLVDRGYVQASDAKFTADTLAGPHPIEFSVDSDAMMVDATVDMGHPILDPKKVPVNLTPNGKYAGHVFAHDKALESPWGDFAFTCVSMGNPHAICFIDDFDALDSALFDSSHARSLATMDINKVGAFFESNAAFPQKTNVEFAHVFPDEIGMRVFERGCGETLACGTGACATSVAAALTDRSGRANKVHLRGGVLSIDWDKNDHVMMTGPAQQVFEGTIKL